MSCKPSKHDNTQKYSKSITSKLQVVYDTIKRERPWDIRSINKMDTTAKEKYLIELIKEGHEISNETISHIVGRCYDIHEFDDGKYICWCGYILTSNEYPLEHMKCRSFHKLNQRMICYNAGIYYPVDILSNPFGEWQPQELNVKYEIQEVYTMIREKWPDHWYENELHKYTLKHLIKLIENGEQLTKDIKRHVVDGCDNDYHRLDDDYHCYSGFLLAESQLKTIKHSAVNGLLLSDGMLEYKMNPKFRMQVPRRISVPELRFRKYHTAQQVTDENIKPCMKNVDLTKIFDRIVHRDLISPKCADKIRLTWQEKYLVDNVMLGEDIPNEVISHVLDGCYTWGHLLTENYACCRGYILTRDAFSNHDVRQCKSHHMINGDLNCYKGLIYHHHAEIPKGNWLGYLELNMTHQLTANPRLPPRPAPPPPDHLDNQPVQHPVVINRQPNLAAANFRQNDNERDDRAVGAENVPPNRHQNAAPPPPEFDI